MTEPTHQLLRSQNQLISNISNNNPLPELIPANSTNLVSTEFWLVWTLSGSKF